MAKISTYPGPSSPSLSDMLIGTDINDMNATKNFTIGDILSVTGSGTYVPYVGAITNVDLGLYDITATTLIKAGGISTQFLKADGTVDTNVVPYTGATADVDLDTNRLITDAVMAPVGTNILYLSPSPFDFVGAKLDFTTGTYSFGDYTSLSNGTYVIIDDANSRIELSKGIYTNGSEGLAGDVLVSQGAGLPATWVSTVYGSFYDVNTQTTAGLTQELMQFGSTDFAAGVSITNDGLGDPTQITFASTGIYNVQFSAQLKKTGGGGETIFYIYLIKNGTPVPNSTTAITLENNNDLAVAAWNWFVDVSTLPLQCQIGWYTNNAVGELHYTTSPYVGVPAIPSVILTVNKVF